MGQGERVSKEDGGVLGGVLQKKRAATGMEHRKHYRHPIHWRIAIIHKNGDKNEIYHGRTHDLSVSGASIMVDRNIFMMSEVVMLLAIPPFHPGQKETIVEIQCRMAYTVLDSEESRFRIGIRFMSFKGDGKKTLADILSRRVIPKSEPKNYSSE
jgi:c-di-GMP-binding flagellar brake protein YcgR